MREDWIECNFEQIITYSKGKKPRNLSKEQYKGFLPYINIKAFEKNIIEEYSDDINTNLCRKGDILMVWDGARAGLVGKSITGIVGSTLMKIEPSVYLDKEFIFYYLKSLYRYLNTNTKGVGIPHIEPNLLWKRLFSLPPIVEQRSITRKIESIFSSLDTSIVDLKKAHEQLKVYRQAVLKKAFEGGLTNEWRKQQNDLPTVDKLSSQIKKEREEYYAVQIKQWKVALKKWEEKLIDKKPNKIKLFKPLNEISNDEFKEDLFEIPKFWKWERLENLIFEVKDGTHDTPKYLRNGIPFITQKNIKNNDIIFDNVQFISNDDHKKFSERSNVEKGDIIIAMIGHNRGNCTIVRSNRIFSIKNVGLFKFFNKIQLNKYFLYFFQFSGGLEIVLKKSKGGAQPFIGLSELRNWPVPYCSHQEQQQIVKEIESRLSACDAVEKQIKNSLDQAEALRQSILKKAFEGNLLTEEELKACKAEPDYEPASVLLERIKAEKEAHKPLKKISKKKVS
ncbi:restriction endonuclease subunit S [Chryseobacterium cucumeris]|uniref:restriction endonuclease subunit S n=1 Tax=Chryseobacterium cucumeris TaxID=1813611 RepID=UPI0037C12A3A